MVQIVEQTREEKLAMYMKLSKKELAEMLITCNELLQLQMPQATISTGTASANFCQHEMQWVQGTGGGFFQCNKCGHTTPQTLTYYYHGGIS